MSNTVPKMANPIGFRPSKELRQKLESIAKEEQRPLSNVIVYIVNQYLSSSNGKLLKGFKIVPEDESFKDHASCL